ncbi:GIY-YIG nuclease family protein [Oceanimonas sp. MB9]|uniref:GIY-YIG nuclease family protein n=1 Tax=Oceanimonas sp. MB9 TaxID=2588453 RepID=UPI0013F68F5C|nr:GIY-YIG nuclease family protein [Oceanimonas sp. MB9]
MYTDRIQILKSKLDELLSANPVPYLNLTESQLPKKGGVYLISAQVAGKNRPYYVGRASTLARRLYTNHLMGNASTARLKKYMVESGEAASMEAAKEFLRQNCSIQWVFEDEYRNRGALEGFFTSVLFPKYGIAPEGKSA